MKNQPDDAPDELQPLRPDLLVTPWLTIHAAHPSLEDPGWFAVSAQAIFSIEEQRYVITGVSIERPIERGGVSAVDLRDVPVMTLVADELARRVHVRTAHGVAGIDLTNSASLADLSREDLRLFAARKYSLARATGLAPLRDLAEYLGVSQSTATRLVASAREQGLLD
ncbi:helix-turn-helix domain-containing protein [Curtobacterium sp. MCPF17_002]|uniref:MarR family transcriptional regulator n=1 Tax=Curtobacterium sp. MCPF17_002 TaxID=2175645 RepID=UPI000DAA52D1|nr:helix-turn-helix domain-containing protein [Curtobacterium sp. MCPF17_002]WIB76799.1 helix-turn-helix domain-containing protein [Curtobacterium sp. MCPF17_002]